MSRTPLHPDDIATQIRLTTRRRYLTALTVAATGSVMLVVARNDIVLAAGTLTLINAIVTAVYAYNRRLRPSTTQPLHQLSQPRPGFLRLIALLCSTAVLLTAAGLLTR